MIVDALCYVSASACMQSVMVSDSPYHLGACVGSALECPPHLFLGRLVETFCFLFLFSSSFSRKKKDIVVGGKKHACAYNIRLNAILFYFLVGVSVMSHNLGMRGKIMAIKIETQV